jgi:hypothetical protein
MSKSVVNQSGPDETDPAQFRLPAHWDNRAGVTKGEAYGELHYWAVDVTVPDDWNEEKDRECFVSADDILYHLENFHGVLTFAHRFFTGQPYEPYDDCVFQHLPVRAKVELLWTLLRNHNPDAESLKRLDCDLRRFVDVDQILMPVLQRWLLAPESVWQRELWDVYLGLSGAAVDFSESIYCLLDGPHFLSVDKINPPLPHALLD